MWVPLHTARFQSEDVYRRLSGWTDAQVANRTSSLATVRAYGAYVYTLMGETFCFVSFDKGQKQADDGSAHVHGRAATLIVRRSRMSAEEAPTAISTGSSSTTQRWASGSQYASPDAASGNATVRVSPGPSVTRR